MTIHYLSPIAGECLSDVHDSSALGDDTSEFWDEVTCVECREAYLLDADVIRTYSHGFGKRRHTILHYISFGLCVECEEDVDYLRSIGAEDVTDAFSPSELALNRAHKELEMKALEAQEREEAERKKARARGEVTA